MKNVNLSAMPKMLATLFILCIITINIDAQDKLYDNTFSLEQVKLLEGPFKRAEDLNLKVLLEYDVDRLLAPFLKEAGLPAKAKSFDNWIGLDGHVGGHYLTALAIHYAATGNEECRRRMDYMVKELKRCQQKWGNGYVGGVPDSRKIFTEIEKGNVGIVWKSWVPWYNVHKTFAGLRDAWLYGGNREARAMFLKLCDWGVNVIAPLTDQQMEQMTACEFGGMDEVFADAYQMTGKEKFLMAAKRFSHKELFESMAAEKDNLDNKHANTQVPKVVGYARIAELGHDKSYQAAADFFWRQVVEERSLALGGNSRREHFPAANDYISYVEDREGPESCNTNNMLKLTENLFRMNPEARYADFYERAMFNHILSTQHPEHGGYVYFTSARPSHYRVYSAPNSAMWCCVGTGMENHGKYGEFIYTHAHDSLFVNLFVASELTWKEKGLRLVQNTLFPDEEGSQLTVYVKKPTRMKLLIRHPSWAGSDMKVVCDGKDFAKGSRPSSYIVIERVWNNGDKVEISTPMQVRVEELKNRPEYIAIMRGPILLAAKTGNDHLDGLVADDSRWGHIASGPLVSVFDSPLIIGTRQEILQKLQNMQPVDGTAFTYRVPALFQPSWDSLALEPFYRIHDSRYALYFLSMTPADYQQYEQQKREREEARMKLDKRTVDAVSTGEQQPEVDHRMKEENSSKGNYEGEAWRDAKEGGFFEYTMTTQGKTNLSLMVRYWGDESGNRTFDILVDGKLLKKENITDRWNKKGFVNQEYPLPEDMLKGKERLTVTFRSHEGSIAGGVFFVRLVEP